MRLVFGLMQSPYILDCTNEINFQNFKEIRHKTVEIVKKCMYYNDISLLEMLENVVTLKGKFIQLIKTGASVYASRNGI